MGEPAKWIKITTSMFEDDKIDFIQNLPEGDTILVIWLRLLTMAGKSNANGYILLQEDIPYDEDMLSCKFKKPISIVKLAISTLLKFKMIEITDHGILIRNFNKHQALDKLNKKREQDRLRQQRKRENDKALLSSPEEEAVENNDMSRVTSRDSHTKNMCDNERDSSYSTSTSISYSSSSYIDNSNLDNSIYSKNDAKEENYIKFFERNFGRVMSPYEFEVLDSYETDGMDPDVIKLALIEAVEFNRRDLSYVKNILNRWINAGITTVAAVEADKLEYIRKNGGNKGGGAKRISKQNSSGGTIGESDETRRLEEIARQQGINIDDPEDTQCDY